MLVSPEVCLWTHKWELSCRRHGRYQQQLPVLQDPGPAGWLALLAGRALHSRRTQQHSVPQPSILHGSRLLPGQRAGTGSCNMCIFQNALLTSRGAAVIQLAHQKVRHRKEGLEECLPYILSKGGALPASAWYGMMPAQRGVRCPPNPACLALPPFSSSHRSALWSCLNGRRRAIRSWLPAMRPSGEGDGKPPKSQQKPQIVFHVRISRLDMAAPACSPCPPLPALSGGLAPKRTPLAAKIKSGFHCMFLLQAAGCSVCGATTSSSFRNGPQPGYR